MTHPFTWNPTLDLNETSTWEANLHVYDKDEWRLVCRRVRPNWTEAKFDQVWNDFIEYKRRQLRDA